MWRRAARRSGIRAAAKWAKRSIPTPSEWRDVAAHKPGLCKLAEQPVGIARREGKRRGQF
jgi:hypothetical protein